MGGPVFNNGPTIDYVRSELALTKTLNVNKTSDVIPSFKANGITYNPRSLIVGEIIKVLAENVTKDGNTGVIVTKSKSTSIIEGRV